MNDETKKDLDLVQYLQGWAISRVAILRARDEPLRPEDRAKVKLIIAALKEPV